MIEILTLLHGLLIGPIEIQLRVPPETALVEVYLGDELLAEHAGPPWKVLVPFPASPSAGRLYIEAFDDSAAPLARIERWVNIDLGDCAVPEGVSRQEATPILIESTAGRGDPTVDSLAEALETRQGPARVLAVEAGPAELLVVQDPPMQDFFHQLTRAYFHQQGLKVGLEERGKRQNEEEALAAAAAVLREAEEFLRVSASSGPRFADPAKRYTDHVFTRWRAFADFEVEGRVRFVWPAGPPVASLEQETAVFPLIGPFDAGEAGVLWNLHYANRVEERQRVADAVAVAGFRASATCGRRAVVLFETVETEDASLAEARHVRSYLRSVQVPLFVLRNRPWPHGSSPDASSGTAADEGTPDRWGSATHLVGEDNLVQMPDTGRIFESFQARIEETLERQRVVWIEGLHLPGEIRLRPEVTDIRLAVGGTISAAVSGDTGASGEGSGVEASQ